jgi:hypothetical protein
MVILLYPLRAMQKNVASIISALLFGATPTLGDIVFSGFSDFRLASQLKEVYQNDENFVKTPAKPKKGTPERFKGPPPLCIYQRPTL